MVEEVNGYYFLRLDEVETLGIKGDKARLAYELSKDQNGIVTCGSRESVQTVAFAEICDKLDIPCNIHIPRGKDTESILRLSKTRCNLIREKVGYNNVLNARAREDAAENGYRFIQLGMLCNEAYDLISQNVEYIIPYLDKINKIVVPVGSGTTLIGILKGLQERNIDINVVGVMCGMDATKNIQKCISYENLELVKSDVGYHAKMDNTFCGIELNPVYETKCIPFMETGDLLYIVAK